MLHTVPVHLPPAALHDASQPVAPPELPPPLLPVLPLLPNPTVPPSSPEAKPPELPPLPPPSASDEDPLMDGGPDPPQAAASVAPASAVAASADVVGALARAEKRRDAAR